MIMKSFLTVGKTATVEVTVERSRFIGHCNESATEMAAKEFIVQIRTEHPQATHNCFAYRIGIEEHPLEYYNDHGEPNGTAGKPILGAILRLNLTNVVIVVTRYFGGKKLGVRGLIDAYGEAASLVLKEAGISEKIPRFTVTLRYGYPDHMQILYRLQQLNAEIETTEFGETVTTQFAVPEERRDALNLLCKELPLL